MLVSEITRQKRTEAELREALAQVKTLKGLLPVCAWCQQIRTSDGRWTTLDQYIAEHSDAQVSHGICDACLEKKYPLK